MSDLFNFDDTRRGRTQAAMMTFLPPLIFALLFPDGFLTVIGYVGLAATIWTAIVPVLLLNASRKKYGKGKNYQVFGHVWLMVWIFLFGLINVLAQLFSRAEILPIFKG